MYASVSLPDQRLRISSREISRIFNFFFRRGGEEKEAETLGRMWPSMTDVLAREVYEVLSTSG